MIFNVSGGGGTALNFRVVGGTTAPSNPKENTIWVNTDKEITGWHFASEQPEDMKEGEAWFLSGNTSSVEFNALKKNNVTVYPMSAKQMVSGSLKDVVAKSYQTGKWVDWWNGELYDNGNEYVSITGGWKITRDKGCKFTKNADTMVIDTSSNSTTGTWIGLENAIYQRFDAFSKLKMTIKSFNAKSNGSVFALMFHPNSGGNIDDSNAISKTESKSTGSTTIEVAIPKGTVCYPHINCFYGTLTIEKVWLE